MEWYFYEWTKIDFCVDRKSFNLDIQRLNRIGVCWVKVL